MFVVNSILEIVNVIFLNYLQRNYWKSKSCITDMSRLNEKNGHSLGYLFVLKYISTSKEITPLKPLQ